MLYRVLMWLSVGWSINDRDRVNFDQVAGGQRRYAEHHVRWLVISEQRSPGLFNNRQAFVAFVIDDVDCDPGDLRRPCTGSSKCSAEIAKHLARLSSKITRANNLAMEVFGLLAETNTILLPVATTTWVYVCGVGRSLGLMHSSVID